ncbi:hypothetical protein [Roseateles sp.]|uniref:hypothetical protein n=1 Tax=Roseateles sp. TaxID=1971397 RepID=UPI003263CF21
MTRPIMLPEASFTPVTTRRLARPELLWQDDHAQAQGFNAERVFCGPVAGDAPNAYADDTRVEWVDHYGGTGVGAAGGSGRCAAHGELQTKGVGPTPLVGHDADAHHSSGEQTVLSALAEAVFAQVFQAALPFGAVPTLAVLLTQRSKGTRLSPKARAITVRPFVLRPAHFMRNMFNQQQRRPQGALAPGLTRDTYRVSQALQYLISGLEDCLGADADDDLGKIDQGFRELTRRLAWQFAASFAKRLPHGSVSCSNISLAGQFIDYGMSHALPTYRRPSDSVQDPWSESQRPLQTLSLLRQQMDKYLPGLRGVPVAQLDELSHLYWTTYTERQSIEMAKMAGLTEDLAQACSPDLLMAWLQAMQRLWIAGGRQVLAPRDPTEAWRPMPVDPKFPDLNRILAAAAPHGGAEAMDRSIAPLVADERMRSQFVDAALAVRRAVKYPLGDGAADAFDTYLARQAERKNDVMPQFERDSWFRIGVVAQMLEEDFQPAAVQTLMAEAVGSARRTLADLAPDIPGTSGIEQVHALSLQSVA